MIKTVKKIYEISKKHLKIILIASLLAIIINVANISRPLIIEKIIDEYLNKGVYSIGNISVIMLGTIYIIIVFFEYGLDLLVSSLTCLIGNNIVYEIRNRVFKFAQNANISFHDKTNSGSLYVKIVNDADDIYCLFSDVFSTVLKDFVLIIAIIGMMLYLNTKLSLLSFIVLPVLIGVVCLFTMIINKMYNKCKSIRTTLNSFLAESIYGIKLIKIFNIQNEKQNECNKYTKLFMKSKAPAYYIQSAIPAVMLIIESIGISIIFVSCFKHFWGIDLEVGVIYVFITYLKALFSPIERIVDNIDILQDAISSINKIYELLDQKDAEENFEIGRKLDSIEGKIEFKNVWFSYDNKNWVLKNVSFVIEPGQTIALVGKTGSGKTTITNLINRFYEIQKGEILLDGVNIKNINKKYLRERIGIILQDPYIFAKSIKENIKLNRNIEDEAILKAVQNASAEDFIKSLPNGLDEVSKERGNAYSIGEKQLLAFSRIFALNPDIFILDEATANIDTFTESLIQKSIDKLSKEKTAIIIAHRLSTIVNVDKIIVLQNGEIIEQGNHKELVKTGGYYSKLYNAYYESLG